MNYKDLRIIFMGTPEFAVASLHALVNADCNIVAVITAPDKPAGRGMKLQESAVKKYAVEKKLLILQPEKLKNPQFIDALKELKPDLGVVVAFRMLPEIVWKLPRLGTINLHGSLLPQYRGAAPINWAIINGEKETGVTTFKLKHEIDTGDILLQKKIVIDENETAGELHNKMKEIGAELLEKTVKGLADGSLKEVSQSSIISDELSMVNNDATNSQHTTQDSQFSIINSPLSIFLKHAPKIFTETCKIDWHRSIDEIHNLIRGLSPYPAAFTQMDGKKLKIYSSQKENIKPDIEAGKLETDQKTYLKFAAADGYIKVLELQLEGKKRMKTEDFLRGYRFQ